MLAPNTATGPTRNFAQAQIAARGGFAIRQRAIDAHAGIAAVADLLGKQFQLTHGARAFAREARQWKTGLQMRAFQQRVAERQNLVRNGIEKMRSIARA